MPLNFTIYRKQEKLIQSENFESASIFSNTTSNKLSQLPVYDPFKGILPGPAKQNITYITSVDPARYNITTDTRLLSTNITFAESQVGQLWWDTSTARYVYYEQPANVQGSETSDDMLAYRRDHWGELFPGSGVDIYEWTSSTVPPAKYTGTGTPRDTTSYVQITVPNKLNNTSSNVYYFWVKDKSTKPNLPNRTLAAIQVANLIKSPKSQNFSFFAPIAQFADSNAYMFYNVQNILAYTGNNVQIQYKISDRDDTEHAQWGLFRENDARSLIPDWLWEKLTDSLCGYTDELVPGNNISNGILIFKDVYWDAVTPAWDKFNWDGELQGQVFPVPDPSLSEKEKYGIDYRPRQSMFRDIYAARKILVQAANELLKYIPIIEENLTWDQYIETSNYWEYTTWYKSGYENIKPTIVFQTINQARVALVDGTISDSDIVQVSNAQHGDRFVIYSVSKIDNTNYYSLEEVAIEDGAIKLLPGLYTVKNSYELSRELRQILNALKTQVFINDYRVDLNTLFFSMTNYVLTEQKNPSWLFKTSYIYVKESNMPLSKDRLLKADKISSVIEYINDAKPYHTKLREYTSSYSNTEQVLGTSYDMRSMNINLSFGPVPLDFNVPENRYIVDANVFSNNINQFLSREDVYTVDLDNYDPDKKGYSSLFPYTFSLNSLSLNNPQTIIPPHDVVGVQIGTEVLIYGKDYYVEYNNDGTYTVYFYTQPSGTPKALIWLDGGSLEYIKFNSERNETALCYPKSGIVVNVDTLLPVNNVSAITTAPWAPIEYAPYSKWGDIWDAVDDPVIVDLLDSNNGMNSIPWDAELTYNTLGLPISYKDTIDFSQNEKFYRNADSMSGILLQDILSTDAFPVIRMGLAYNILPDVTSARSGAVWIDGERIEYKKKQRLPDGNYLLSDLRRATRGTAATDHIADGGLSVNRVWIERNNQLPGNAQGSVWNASVQFSQPDEAQAFYTNVTSVPAGGLWYARTDQSMFLKQYPGQSIQ